SEILGDVAQVPAAHAGRNRTRIEQLDSALQRQAGVVEDFVDDGVGQGQIVAFARRWHAGEAHDSVGAIGQAALGDTRLLQTEIDTVNQGQVGSVESQRFTVQIQVEVDVVTTLARIPIGIEFGEALRSNKRQRRDDEFREAINGWIISQVEAA